MKVRRTVGKRKQIFKRYFAYLEELRVNPIIFKLKVDKLRFIVLYNYFNSFFVTLT